MGCNNQGPVLLFFSLVFGLPQERKLVLMKSISRSLLLLILASLAFGQVQAGDPLASFNAISAEEFQLNQYQGQVVLMDFWASWCKPCEKSMPWLADLQTCLGSDGLQVVAVNMDKDWQDAAKMAATLPPEILLVHDPEGVLAGERNLQGMPSAYLYDRQGQLNAVHVGFIPNETAHKEAEIKALLDGAVTAFDPNSVGSDTAGVQPWQRDLLAAPGMAIDPDPIETALNEHVYFSKESSSGGIGSAGGGCGCN